MDALWLYSEYSTIGIGGQHNSEMIYCTVVIWHTEDTTAFS